MAAVTPPTCPFWRACNIQGGGCCAAPAPRPADQPAWRTCCRCPIWRKADPAAQTEFCRSISTFRVGDAIERAAKPIARALGHPCLDEFGRLKPEGGCAKARNAINAVT